jgi:hypothetical protein
LAYHFPDLGSLLNLVLGDETVEQQVSNLLAGPVPAQSIAFYASSKAVGCAFTSSLALLNDVIDFPCALRMIWLSVTRGSPQKWQ